MSSRTDTADGECGRCALRATRTAEQRIDEGRLVAASVLDAKEPRLDGELR
jgi:hypothetical protein